MRLHDTSPVLLQFLRAVTSCEGKEGPAKFAQLVTDSLVSTPGLLEDLLCMLAALGPIKPGRYPSPLCPLCKS